MTIRRLTAWLTADSDVTIEPAGTRGGDFARANETAGLDRTPAGYTWHHHQDYGAMQLVDRATHAATGHTGGFSIWGRFQLSDMEFDDSQYYAGPDLTDALVTSAEARLGYRLPESYLNVLRVRNGGRPPRRRFPICPS